MMTRPLAILGYGLFAVSFASPAFQIDVETFMGWRVDVHESVAGWEAAWFAFAQSPDRDIALARQAHDLE